MAVNPADVISALERIRWRTLFAPLVDASGNVTHTQVVRAYPYLDVDGHSHTGRRSKALPVTIRLQNGLEGRADWYPSIWRGWYAALEDGLPGPMTHPIFGQLTARVMSYEVTAIPGIRSGIDVKINFVETRERPDTPLGSEAPTVDLDRAAFDADAAVEAVKVIYPDGKVANALANQAAIVKVLYPVAGSDGTISDIASGTTLDNPLTIAQQVNRATELLRGYIAAFDIADNPDIWAAYDSVETAIQSVRVSGEKALNNARPVKVYLAPSDTTLDAAAVLLKRDLDDIISLNPGLLSAPFVPIGSRISYYAST